MIPNIVNVLSALALTYVAILRPGMLGSHEWLLPSCAALIFVMALWARRSDYLRWQSNTNMVLAVFLMASSLLRTQVSSLFTFWLVLWVCILVATLSLWAALHRPQRLAGT